MNVLHSSWRLEPTGSCCAMAFVNDFSPTHGYFSSGYHYMSERDTRWSDIMLAIEALNNHPENEHIFEPVHCHEGGIGFYLNGRADEPGKPDDQFIQMRFNDVCHWNQGFRLLSQWPSCNHSFAGASDEFPIFFKEVQLQVSWKSRDYFWTKVKLKKYENIIMECLGYTKTRAKYGFAYKSNILKRKHELGLRDRGEALMDRLENKRRASGKCKSL